MLTPLQVQSFVAAVVEQKMQKITRLSDETEASNSEKALHI
jgi:hypothetical protein